MVFNKRITIRVNDEEYEYIQHKVKKTGLTMNDIMRFSIELNKILEEKGILEEIKKKYFS
jgi:antitoxin component of RelBE/YafQ-DinJ toxin-antitoxin module